MTRFDLEQQIMECWGVVDDIQSVIDGFDYEEMTEDKILNLLIGIRELYNLKFQKTFGTFENLLDELREEI